MYVRGCVPRAGRQTRRSRPACSLRVVDHTAVVPVRPARIICVATADICTVAGRVSRKRTIAASRNPSPFGLTVVSRRRSPAKGRVPSETERSSSCGGATSTSAAASGAITGRSVEAAGLRSCLQFPYVPLKQRTPRMQILRHMSRALVFLAVLALGLPAGAAATATDIGDGTLSIKDGRGSFTIAARGGIIGTFARGSVVITDPVADDGTGPIVSGDDWPPVYRNETTTVYGGTRVRFRLIGGRFRIKVQGTGVNLSLVVKGQIPLNGKGTGDDGTYSVNGESPIPVPDIWQFLLSSTSP